MAAVDALHDSTDEHLVLEAQHEVHAADLHVVEHASERLARRSLVLLGVAELQLHMFGSGWDARLESTLYIRAHVLQLGRALVGQLDHPVPQALTLGIEQQAPKVGRALHRQGVERIDVLDDENGAAGRVLGGPRPDAPLLVIPRCGEAKRAIRGRDDVRDGSVDSQPAASLHALLQLYADAFDGASVLIHDDAANLESA